MRAFLYVPQSAQILQGIIDLSACFSFLFSPFAVNDICTITGLIATIGEIRLFHESS